MRTDNIDQNVVYLGLVSFFTDFASSMITPILPIFIVAILQSGVDKLGIIVAISTFVSYFLRLFSGYISDRYHIVKPMVVVGYFISAISKPLLYYSAHWKSVAVLRGIERLGKAVRSAPKDVLISSYAKINQSGKTFGFHKMLDIAGELGGSVFIFILLFFVGNSEKIIRGIFMLTIIPGLIAVMLIVFFVKDVPYKKGEPKEFALEKEDKKLLVPLGFYFLYTFFIFNESFLVLRSQAIGFSITVIPLLVVLHTLTQTLLSYKVGVFFDKIGANKLLFRAYGAGIIATILFLFPFKVFAGFGFILFGGYTVTTLNVFRAFISQKAKNKGPIYGIFYMGTALSTGLGAMVIGYIWEYFNNGSIALLFSLTGALLIMVGNIIYTKIYNG